MKRSTIIYQKITNENSYDLLRHVHRMWIRYPKKCKKLLNKLSYNEIKSREKWVSHQYWWFWKGQEFEEFLMRLASEKYRNMGNSGESRETLYYLQSLPSKKLKRIEDIYKSKLINEYPELKEFIERNKIINNERNDS